MLSMTSDYAAATGCPEPHLRRIAEAGFTHVHWCHQWNTDFLYDDCEVAQIAAWFEELDLTLCDLHATVGVEKNWGSVREYERRAGVALVANRIAMTARLGADVIIMHLPRGMDDDATGPAVWSQFRRSLDELRPIAARHGVRIAIENGPLATIADLLSQYDADYLGLCYDSGHGNLVSDGLDWLSRLKDRLISVHLHDNDGASDQHKLLFTGSVDWPRLADVLAQSAYAKPISMETSIRNTGIDDERELLARAFETGQTLSQMVAERRSA